MIIHSVIPMETIFANMDQVEKQEIKEVAIGHATMLIEQTGPFEGRIVRMISPDPQDYLNPRFAPGQMIPIQPEGFS
ncbi:MULTISPECIES: YlzJ-like family protein [Brevibacillus]|uniref:YlzJ-like family protein n=1 Tax=Brevibacillus TaxID=55080 RepID=UPI00203BF054|nr:MULTISPECIES: YlzJ-like family protein [Brevibacillus]MCM3078954.1 YlzJ-like family protein [Brevibacillus invocatus]MCM3428944.1 YlzJ-like family protein [Brevibacillus invocatus]MDH4617255.1 YlzJ-like family protein [Brevibacillus sp. AY1]